MDTTADAAIHTVGEVARLAGLTVRTLHHYDDVGLLHPSGRTASGYRSYDTADLETTVRYGSNPNAKAITTYFRHRFVVADVRDIIALTLRVRRDDGRLPS